MILRLVIPILVFYSTAASALSCVHIVHFIVRCQDDVCTEGFFAPRRMAGESCETILDVQENEPIQKFDGKFGPLRKGDSEKLNGYFRIGVMDRFRLNRNVENLRCFKRNDEGAFSLICSGERMKMEKLDYPADREISSVISDLVSQSKRANILNWMLDLLLPAVTLPLMIWSGRRFRKRHGNKLAAVVFLVSSIGISHFFLGRASWFLTCIVGWLFCLVWIIAKLLDRRGKASLKA